MKKYIILILIFFNSFHSLNAETYTEELYEQYKDWDITKVKEITINNWEIPISQVKGHEQYYLSENVITDFSFLLSATLLSYTNAPDDKVKHYTAGMIIGVVARNACKRIDFRVDEQTQKGIEFLCGFGAATLAGVLKEVYDSTGRGDVDILDAGATALGGLLISIPF